jgi:hypothetical protein
MAPQQPSYNPQYNPQPGYQQPMPPQAGMPAGEPQQMVQRSSSSSTTTRSVRPLAANPPTGQEAAQLNELAPASGQRTPAQQYAQPAQQYEPAPAYQPQQQPRYIQRQHVEQRVERRYIEEPSSSKKTSKSSSTTTTKKTEPKPAPTNEARQLNDISPAAGKSENKPQVQKAKPSPKKRLVQETEITTTTTDTLPVRDNEAEQLNAVAPASGAAAGGYYAQQQPQPYVEQYQQTTTSEQQLQQQAYYAQQQPYPPQAYAAAPPPQPYAMPAQAGTPAAIPPEANAETDDGQSWYDEMAGSPAGIVVLGVGAVVAAGLFLWGVTHWFD